MSDIKLKLKQRKRRRWLDYTLWVNLGMENNISLKLLPKRHEKPLASTYINVNEDDAFYIRNNVPLIIKLTWKPWFYASNQKFFCEDSPTQTAATL